MALAPLRLGAREGSAPPSGSSRRRGSSPSPFSTTLLLLLGKLWRLRRRSAAIFRSRARSANCLSFAASIALYLSVR